jgi:uncharacterized protein (TIGR02145 family)
MKTLTKLLCLIYFFSVPKVNAQNYLLSFAGSGASTTVSSVKVENLMKGTSLILNGSDILRLTITTGTKSLENTQSSQLRIYPNPMTDNTILEINPPIDGDASISIYDLTGKLVAQTRSYFDNFRQDFRLSGFENGFYIINVKGNSYQFSEKLISNGKASGSISIEKINTVVQAVNEKAEVTSSKGILTTNDMEYTTGDRLKFTGISENYSTVKIDIPISDKTITFNFIECTDGDNNSYPVVQIGTQIWMEENLKTTKYSNGDLIGTTTPATLDISGESTPKYQWAYNGDESNVAAYGRLYTGFTVTDSRNICPTDWHVPSSIEWSKLKNYLIVNSFNYDGTTTGNKIGKSMATSSFWPESSTPGAVGYDQISNNSSGFTAKPAGYTSAGTFSNIGLGGYWWSSTEYLGVENDVWGLYYNIPSLETVIQFELEGMSVRCLKNPPCTNEQAFPEIEGTFDDIVVDGNTITCKTINNIHVFQGDIILTEAQLTSTKGTATSSISKRWTNGIIYFKINSNLPQRTRESITLAIADYEANTTLRFVERTDETNYMEFINSETLSGIFYGTCSNLGMIGGRQYIWLEPTWNTSGTIIHEMGHTIGLIHEQSRSDRDDSIDILWDNILDSWKDQYLIKTNSFYKGDFDFNSIMLYSSINSSSKIQGTPVMLKKSDSSVFYAQHEVLSSGDIEMINELYGGLPPDADFTSSQTFIIKGGNVQFYDQSSNNPIYWYWRFGDGANSSEKNPSHTYNTVGTFTVVLTATNIYEKNIEIKVGYITVNAPTPIVTDIENNNYSTIQIGTQIWMAENLRTTKFNDGSDIPLKTDDTEWTSLATPGMCWYDNYPSLYKNTYGGLYNWYTVNNGNLCPGGWHVPSDDEFKVLEIYLGLTQEEADGYNYRGTDQGSQMKTSTGWYTNDYIDGNGTNTSGFSALPSGERDGVDGRFLYDGLLTHFLCTNEYDSISCYMRDLYYAIGGIERLGYNKTSGFSVRCIKD